MRDLTKEQAEFLIENEIERKIAELPDYYRNLFKEENKRLPFWLKTYFIERKVKKYVDLEVNGFGFFCTIMGIRKKYEQRIKTA